MRIMQCWDDGDVDDIRLVEILRKHGARATFNINPGGWKSKRREAHRFKGEYQVYRLTLDEMPQVYKGFCIGGHTMTHPLLDAIDPDWALAELVACKQYIGKHLFRAREMDLERTSVVHTLPRILRKDSHMLRIPFSSKILSFDSEERKEAVREKVAHPNSFREGKPDF